MNKKIRLIFKSIPPVFLLVFFVATISVYIAIERYVSAKNLKGKVKIYTGRLRNFK